MKKIMLVMLSAFLITMVGSLPSSAKKVTVTKLIQVDKTCDMRYLVGTPQVNLMNELGDRYWLWDCGDKTYCHDALSNHHWVFFHDGTYTITQAEPFHYVGQAFDPAYYDWWYEQCEADPLHAYLYDDPYQPTEDDIVIDYGQVYPAPVIRPRRLDFGSISMQFIR